MQTGQMKAAPGVALLGAKLACGDDVYDAAGEYVGKVEEFVFDSVAGRIAYTVIAVGGFLGIGLKRFAVPWSAMSFDMDYKRCMLNIDYAQLMDAPALDDDHWLRIADPAWADEIQAYYGGRACRA